MPIDECAKRGRIATLGAADQIPIGFGLESGGRGGHTISRGPHRDNGWEK